MSPAEVVAKALRDDWFIEHVDGCGLPENTADLLADLVEIGERHMNEVQSDGTNYEACKAKLAALALIVDPDSKEARK